MNRAIIVVGLLLAVVAQGAEPKPIEVKPTALEADGGRDGIKPKVDALLGKTVRATGRINQQWLNDYKQDRVFWHMVIVEVKTYKEADSTTHTADVCLYFKDSAAFKKAWKAGQATIVGKVVKTPLSHQRIGKHGYPLVVEVSEVTFK